MTKASFPGDTITLKDISTGGASAGNGGDGYNKGDITNHPTIDFNPYNQADSVGAYANTGDKAYGGHAYSHGDQGPWSGHDTPNASADTTANQSNFLAADMGQQVAAGIGGNGGDGNLAKGGDFESTNLNDLASTHYAIDDFGHA